jgi:hypothetical protein
MRRPANGRDPLPQPYNEDFIPASAGFPGPTRVAIRPAALPEKRKTEVTSRYDAEAQEVVIRLGFCDPDAEKTEISSAIRFARSRGPLKLITVVIESETYGTPSGFQWARRNNFVRNEGRESDMQTRGQIVLEKRMEESRG